MMGRILLAVALALSAMPTASADPPLFMTGQSPYHGNYALDPILYYVVGYSDPGTTDCYTAYFGSCVVEGPGTNAHWVKIEIVGTGNASFFLDDYSVKPPKALTKGTCESTLGRAECFFDLPRDMSSPDFRMQVIGTRGAAGTFIDIELEAGLTVVPGVRL